MAYELGFLESALKAWKKLDATVRGQFKAHLLERLASPRVPSAKLRGHPDRYKAKLKSVRYRLVYEVRDHQITAVVVAVGKRERDAVCLAAAKR